LIELPVVHRRRYDMWRGFAAACWFVQLREWELGAKRENPQLSTLTLLYTQKALFARPI
jgi:hypothetical protein